MFKKNEIGNRSDSVFLDPFCLILIKINFSSDIHHHVNIPISEDDC